MTKNDWTIIIVALIAYQFYATVLVVKSDAFDDQQKLRMVVVIWLIPVIGAVLVRIRLRAVDHDPPR